MEPSQTTPTTALFAGLGIKQTRLARMLGVGPRAIRRWRSGARRTPRAVEILFRLIGAGVVTRDQLEEASKAAALLAKAVTPTDPVGGAGPMPDDGGTTLAEPDSTAAKVFALPKNGCRFSVGDPQNPDFAFCGEPVVAPGKSYCQAHYDLSCLSRPARAVKPVVFRTRPEKPGSAESEPAELEFDAGLEADVPQIEPEPFDREDAVIVDCARARYEAGGGLVE
jgi:hypothetical protein